MPHVDANGATIYGKNECDQNADPTMPGGEALREAWWTLRRGVPSSSEFTNILTAKKLQIGAGAETYINKLIGDLLSLEYPVKEEFDNFHTRRGRRVKPQARRWVELEINRPVKQVGIVFSKCKRFAASPDGTIEDDGLLELKAPAAHTHVEYLRDGVVPADYLMQVHGQLLVSGRKYVRFVSYHPGMPSLNVVVTPNEITQKLAAALEEFWTRYKAALEQIRSL